MATSGAQRAAAAAATLVVAWIGTYWLWEPTAGSDRITFDGAPAVPPTAEVDRATTGPRPEPDQSIEPVETPEVVEPAPEQGTEQADAQPEEQGPRVVPPEFREYTIRRDDDLMSLSQRFFGTTRHWQAIAKANPDMDPNRLRAGRVILIPNDPTNIQGRVVGADGGEVEPPPPEPEYVEHIVQRGDTLWEIAASIYGDGTKWTVIRDANVDLVGSDGSRLRPGMTLRVPPPADGAR